MMFIARYRKLLNVVLGLWLIPSVVHFVDLADREDDEMAVALEQLEGQAEVAREALEAKAAESRVEDEEIAEARERLDSLDQEIQEVGRWINERREPWSWWRNVLVPLSSLASVCIGFYVVNAKWEEVGSESGKGG